MPVFLSHKREDTNATLLLAHYLERNGVICYVDVLDESTKTTDDLTSLLMSRVRQCTHIMAVVSDNTEKSWWVSFEIGVASELTRRVTTYRLAEIKLPDYLTKWPVLSSYTDLDRFIYHYKLDATVQLQERTYGSSVIQTASQFHSELKRSLGQ